MKKLNANIQGIIWIVVGMFIFSFQNIAITTLSVLMLGEKVGPRRWLALLIGFAGVLFIVRPGTSSFNWGSVFVFMATIFYALSLMLTRRLREDDSSAGSWVVILVKRDCLLGKVGDSK